MKPHEVPKHHSHRIVGPAGSGKVLWARQYHQRMRWKDKHDDAHSSRLHRLAGLPSGKTLIPSPPFRAPHHTASTAAMRGAFRHGYEVQPGELSLAHGGVLLLDEANEFTRVTLELVTFAMEQKSIVLAGSNGNRVELPADFTVIVASSPCPCGYHNFDQHRCRCKPGAIERYNDRLPEQLRNLPLIDFELEKTS